MALSAGAIAGLQAGAGLASDVASGIFGSIHAKKAFKRNQRAWRRQNKYNHPAEQMKRLKEAGLNPNMVYGGSVGGSTGNATGMPSASAPTTPNFKGFDALSKLLMHAQVRQVEQQTENLKVDGAIKTLELNDKELDYFSKIDDPDFGEKGNYQRYQNYKKAEYEIRALERDILSGNKKAIMDQAVQTARKLTAEASIAEKEMIIRKFEADLIEKYKLNKAFVAIIMNQILGNILRK